MQPQRCSNISATFFSFQISLATLSFNVYLYVTVSNILKSLLAEPEIFADFSYLEVKTLI